MLKKLFISCDQATTICDKSQYNEASFGEIIKLKIHFIFCKFCRLYTKQNTKITLLLSKNVTKQKAKENCLSSKEKALLKEQLKMLE